MVSLRELITLPLSMNLTFLARICSAALLCAGCDDSQNIANTAEIDCGKWVVTCAASSQYVFNSGPEQSRMIVDSIASYNESSAVVYQNGKRINLDCDEIKLSKRPCE